MAEMVTIPKHEYDRLKRLAGERDVLRQFEEGLEDLKAGRIRRVA